MLLLALTTLVCSSRATSLCEPSMLQACMLRMPQGMTMKMRGWGTELQEPA